MNRFRSAHLAAALTLFAITAMSPPVDAQGRGGRRPPPLRPGPVAAAPRVPVVRGQVVFIGGYFYDPFFGPYPWWQPANLGEAGQAGRDTTRRPRQRSPAPWRLSSR